MMNFRNQGGFNPGPVGLLIITNVVLFIPILINRYLGNLMVGLFGFHPDTFFQQPWTILTALFIHGGIGHILGNMFTLYFFGSYLIQLVGNRNFLIIYFAGGILGNIFYLLLGPPVTAIGASGAVFAVGGALSVMRPNLKVIIFPIPAPIPLWIAVIGGFLLTTAVSSVARIAWEGHLGGLVLGLAAGYFFRRRERRWRW